MAEVIEPGESGIPAPGPLKKGGKDEKSTLNVATTLILSLTITEFHLLLNKQRAQEYTHTLGSRALRLTYLRDYNKNSYALPVFTPLKDLLTQVFSI